MGGRLPHRILGIDPGSRCTGYAFVDSDGRTSRHVASGSIRVGESPWPQRLGELFEGISRLVEAHAPNEVAIEQLIFARDPRAALKLGQARGAVMCAALQHGLAIVEYSPKTVKQAVVGTGRADKHQVREMVKLLLTLAAEPSEDEADALALAICHAHSMQIPRGSRMTASWRDWRP